MPATRGRIPRTRSRKSPDEELLTIELGELKLEGFDLSLTGFRRSGARRGHRRALIFPPIKKAAGPPMQMADKIIMPHRGVDPLCPQRADAFRGPGRANRRTRSC